MSSPARPDRRYRTGALAGYARSPWAPASYNVDGGDIVPEHEDDLIPELRRHPPRFRHSTTVDLGFDRFPCEERLVERRS